MNTVRCEDNTHLEPVTRLYIIHSDSHLTLVQHKAMDSLVGAGGCRHTNRHKPQLIATALLLLAISTELFLLDLDQALTTIHFLAYL